MKPTIRSLVLALFTFLQASVALSDAPLIWGPNNTAKLLNSGELVGKNGDIYLHSAVPLIFPAANAKGPLINNGTGTLSWLVGNTNSFVGFNSTGDMISIPGYSWDQTTQALNANTNFDPFVNGYTAYSLNANSLPTADNVNNISVLNTFTNCGGDDSGFSCGDPATGAGGLYGINSGVNSTNKSSVGHTQLFNGYSQFGNGTDPITVHDMNGMSIGETLGTGVSMVYANQFTSNMQAQAGSSLSSFTAFSEQSFLTHLLQNYSGIQLNTNITTIDGYYNAYGDNPNLTTVHGGYNSANFSPNIGSVSGTYNGISISPNVVSSALTAEQFQITAVADVAQSLASKYLTFCEPYTNGGTCWAPWFKVSGTGTDPMVPGYTMVEVDIATGDTAATVGTALYNAVNALTVNLTWADSGTGVVTGTAVSQGQANQANAQDSGFAVVMTAFGGGDGQAVALNINMGNATGFADGNVKAIDANGNVNINGKLQTGTNAPMTDQGGTQAQPVNTINTNFTVAPGVTVNNADMFGFGPIANLTMGANSHANASPGLGVGASSLGMIGLITMDNGSTATNVNGSFIAQVLVGGTGAGGVIDDMNAYRAVSANFGSPTTVTNSRAFLADDTLGAPATNHWGFYAKSAFENYMGKSLKIGGAAGAADKVSNSSVGLEIDPTLALLPDPMTTTVRDALTPLTGMLVNNSTTNKLQRYDGSAWEDVGPNGTSIGGPYLDASNTFANGNSYTNEIFANPTPYIAQRFTATNTGNFVSYETKMQNFNGPTGVELQAELWSDNGLSGANSDIGSLLASSTNSISDSTLLISSINSLATSSVPSSIYNFSGYPVVSGTMYWVVVRTILGSLGANRIFTLTNTGTTSPPARAPGISGGLTETTYFKANVAVGNQFVLSNALNYLDSSFLNYNVDFGGNVLSGVSTPLVSTDAANKSYVDSLVFTGTTGSVPFVDVMGSLAENNAKFFWDNTNFRLGIGTSSPSSRLHIVDTVTTSPRGITSDQISSSTSASQLNLRKARGTPSVPTAVLNLDSLSNIISSGHDGTSYGTGSTIQSSASEDWSPTAHGTSINFNGIQTGTLINQTRLSLNGNGNVTVGSTADGSKFNVSGNASVGASYTFIAAPTNGLIVQGNVGIGTSSPAYLLDIGTIGSKFQVDSSGNTVRIRDIPTAFPTIQGAAGTFLTNDGSGNLSWASAPSPANIATLSGGTTTLTLSSNKNQYYTLTAASTVTLPGSGVPDGYTFTFYTLGDFDLVVQSDDGTPITTANGAVLDATTRYGSVTLVANRHNPSVVTDWNVANVYERYNDTITTSGALSVSVVGAYTRNNHLVSIDWNTGSEYISGTAAGTNTVTWGNIPTRFRPAAIRTGQTLTLSTTNQSGLVQLTSGGGFTIYKDLSFNPFTGAVTASVYSFSMSWSI